MGYRTPNMHRIARSFLHDCVVVAAQEICQPSDVQRPDDAIRVDRLGSRSFLNACIPSLCAFTCRPLVQFRDAQS
jgi:hypothetical protein